MLLYMEKIKMQLEKEDLFVVVNEPQEQIQQMKASRNKYLYPSVNLVQVWLFFTML